MTAEKYLIHELAEKARTTVRTIRYYADEGLLPQPELQGKYAYYRHAHLERLELIRQMKEAYLPLREIRQLLLNLTDSEVHERLSEPEAGSQVAESPALFASVQAEAEDVDNARAYIARLVGKQTGLGKPPAVRPSPFVAPVAPLKQAKSDADEVTVQAGEPALKAKAVEGRLYSQQTNSLGGQVWRHIHLAPGVELQVAEPMNSEVRSRLHLLIQYVQKLFGNDESSQ